MSFVPHRESKFRDILDGLANTVAMGEIATDLGDRNRTSSTRNRSLNPPRAVRDNPKWCADRVRRFRSVLVFGLRAFN